MSTNIQRERTKHIRIGLSWHRCLKLRAFYKEITISELLAEICKAHFESDPDTPAVYTSPEISSPKPIQANPCQ